MTRGADVQAVVFNLGGETFALPVSAVREILDYREAFQMPQGPAWLAGMIDVRGEAMPMIDLRTRLGLSPAGIGATTRILVTDLVISGRSLALGLIVDRVLDVATFAADTIEATPDIGVRWRSDYIEGLVRQPAGFVVLLAPDRVLTAEDGTFALDQLDQAA